jgi:hypothetical protein
MDNTTDRAADLRCSGTATRAISIDQMNVWSRQRDPAAAAGRYQGERTAGGRPANPRGKNPAIAQCGLDDAPGRRALDQANFPHFFGTPSAVTSILVSESSSEATSQVPKNESSAYDLFHRVDEPACNGRPKTCTEVS